MKKKVLIVCIALAGIGGALFVNKAHGDGVIDTTIEGMTEEELKDVPKHGQQSPEQPPTPETVRAIVEDLRHKTNGHVGIGHVHGVSRATVIAIDRKRRARLAELQAGPGPGP